MQKIEKRKQRERVLTWRLPVRPAAEAGPAHHCSPPSSSSPRPEAAACSHAHGRAATSCLPTSSWPRGRLPQAVPIPPALSHSLPALPSSLSLSLSHGRTPPSPPFAIAAIPGHPSLPRLAQELRLDSLFLPTAPQLPGSPASPPRRRSPLRAPTIIAVKFAVSSASPSPLRRPLQPR